jgi:hypothetical protein
VELIATTVMDNLIRVGRQEFMFFNSSAIINFNGYEVKFMTHDHLDILINVQVYKPL